MQFWEALRLAMLSSVSCFLQIYASALALNCRAAHLYRRTRSIASSGYLSYATSFSFRRICRKAFFSGIPGTDLFRHHKRRIGPAQLFAHCRHFDPPAARRG